MQPTSVEKDPRLKILIAVIPAAGHLNPLLAMALALRDRGHEMLFVTGLSKRDLIASHGFGCATILQGTCDTMEQLNKPLGKAQNNFTPRAIHKQVKNILRAVRAGVSECEVIAQEFKPDLVISDFSTPVGSALAKRLGLPWVTVTQSPFCIRNHAGTPGFLGGLCKPRHRLHRLRDWLGNRLIDIVRFAVHVTHLRDWRALDLKLNGPRGSDGLYSPYAIISTTAWEFEFTSRWPCQLHMVGPILFSDAFPLDDCLRKKLQIARDGGKKVIFVTFGTHLEQEKTQFFEKVKTLASGSPHVYVFNSGGSHLSVTFEPPSFSEQDNLILTSYVNYNEILGYCDAVIHPGSAGIAYTCLAKGIPTLVLPQANDQFDIAARVQASGTGLKLKASSVTLARLRASVERLLTCTEIRLHCETLSHRINSYKGIESSVAIIEKVGNNRSAVENGRGEQALKSSRPLSALQV